MGIRKRERKILGKKRFVYGAEVYVRGVRVAYKSFDTRGQAEDWYLKAKASYSTGEPLEQSLPKRTLRDIVELYKEERLPQLRASTQQNKEKPIEYILTSPIADMRMSELTDQSIDRWFDWLRKHPTAQRESRKFFLEEFRFLRALLNWYRDYHDPKFVVPIVKRHREQVKYKPVTHRRPDYFMRREDILQWLEWLRINKPSRPEYYRLALFLLHTGARIGEAAGLCWDAVDLENGFVSVIRTVWWDRHTRKPSLQNQAKNDESIRIIPLAKPVLEMLRELKVQRVRHDGPVFCTPEGNLLSYPSIQNAFNRGFMALGLPWRSTHICRHSFGTLALLATRDLSAVQASLGHNDIRVTQRYAKAVALLDGVASHKTAEFIGLGMPSHPPEGEETPPTKNNVFHFDTRRRKMS